MNLLRGKILPTGLFAGVASVAFAGAVAAHTLNVQLPDGTTEQINYAGDVAPQVSFVPPVPAPVADWAAGPHSPFALMQRIAAQMDREADVMMREMQAIAFQPVPGPGQPLQVDLTKLPPGTQSYSFVSTLSPSGVCSQSTEIIAQGPGQKPQVISHTTGNCGPADASGTTHVAAPNANPAIRSIQPRGHTYRARLDQTAPIDHPDYRSMFRQASW